MYIGSTNLFLDTNKYDTIVPSSLIASEKYEYCEDFYQSMMSKQKSRFFRRRSK